MTKFNIMSVTVGTLGPRVILLAEMGITFKHIALYFSIILRMQFYLVSNCCGASEPEASERSSSIMCAERGF